LEFDAFSDDFSRGIFVLGNLEIALSGLLSVGSGLLSLRVCRMGFIDDHFAFVGTVYFRSIRTGSDLIFFLQFWLAKIHGSYRWSRQSIHRRAVF